MGCIVISTVSTQYIMLNSGQLTYPPPYMCMEIFMSMQKRKQT